MAPTAGRDRRPSARAQAAIDELNEKQTHKNNALARVQVRKTKKSKGLDNNQTQGKASSKEQDQYRGPLSDAAFSFNRGRNQSQTQHELAPRKEVVPPAPKPTKHRLTEQRAQELLQLRNNNVTGPPRQTKAQAADKERQAQPSARRVEHMQVGGALASRALSPVPASPFSLSPAAPASPGLDVVFNRDPPSDDSYLLYQFNDSDYGYDNSQDPYAPPDPDEPDPSWTIFEDIPAIGERTKRARCDSTGSDIQPMRKVKKNEGAEGKTKASHYDAEVQEILYTAMRYYRLFLSMRTPYPDALTEVAWAKDAWAKGCRIHGASIAHDSQILGLITARGSHLRGEVKTKAKDWIVSLYGFQNTTKPKLIRKQQQRAEVLLKNFSYIYRNPGLDGETRTGFLKSRAIEGIINAVWFKTRKGKADAIVMRQDYQMFPVAAIALVITAIKCAIDEWSTGSYNTVAFYASQYKGAYEDTAAMLKAFHAETQALDIIPNLQEAIFKAGCAHANEVVTDAVADSTLSAEAVRAAIKEYNDKGFDWDDNGSESEDTE